MPVDYDHLEKAGLQELLTELGNQHENWTKTKDVDEAEEANSNIGFLETEILQRFQEKTNKIEGLEKANESLGEEIKRLEEEASKLRQVSNDFAKYCNH